MSNNAAFKWWTALLSWIDKVKMINAPARKEKNPKGKLGCPRERRLKTNGAKECLEGWRWSARVFSLEVTNLVMKE
jgi:hypothetical protein